MQNSHVAEQFERRLAKMANASEARARATLRAHVEKMAERMRRSVPVDTGRLRDSITIVPTGNPGEFRVILKDELAGGTHGSAPINQVASHIEFGTQNRQARPFWFASYRTARGPMFQAVRVSGFEEFRRQLF